MFPCRMSLLEVRISCRLVACSYVTLENVAVLCEWCPSGRDSSLNLFVLDFVFGAVSVTSRFSFQRSRSECC